MKYLQTLLKLKKNKELNYSAVPQSLLKKLLEENLVSISTLTPKRKKVRVKEEFFEVYKDIEKLEDVTTRSELIHSHTHTKEIVISPQEGLYLNGNCLLKNVQLPLFEKSAIFLKEIPIIDENILIVGLENYENLIYFKSLLSLFQNDNILFVYRNRTMREFFRTIPNRKIYFGDFDLAGIAIYLNEIVPLDNTIEYFIPKDLDIIIAQFGNNYLYEKQLSHYKNLSSTSPKIQKIIDTIHTNQKSLEQEYFIQ